MKMDSKQRFRKLLTKSGWSQAEASRQLGMTPSALSQIVRHNSPVQPSGVTSLFFQSLVNSKLPPKTAAEKWETDLIAAMRKLPGYSRRTLLKKITAHISRLRQPLSNP